MEALPHELWMEILLYTEAPVFLLCRVNKWFAANALYKITSNMHYRLTDNVLKKLPALSHINISTDNITSDGLKDCPKLTSMFIFMSKGIDNGSIMNCTALTSLQVFGPSLITAEGLDYCPNISTLNLPELSDNIKHCAAVTDLTIIGGSFSNTGLSRFTNLTKLSVAGNRFISGDGLKFCPLRSLKLNANSVIRDYDLQSCPQLDTLHLGMYSPCGDIGLSYCANITELYIGNGNVTDTGLRYLPNLKKLSMIGCRNITDAGLLYCSQLVYLNIQNTVITDEGLKHCAGLTGLVTNQHHGISALTNLTDLTIKPGSTITGSSLQYCPNLTRLVLPGLNKFDNDDLRYVRLKILAIPFSENMTDGCLKHCADLDELDIGGNKFITDDGLRHCAMLKKLNLGPGSFVTAAGINYCTQLVELILTDRYFSPRSINFWIPVIINRGLG